MHITKFGENPLMFMQVIILKRNTDRRTTDRWMDSWRMDGQTDGQMDVPQFQD